MMPLIYQKNQIQIPLIYPKYTYIQYGDKQYTREIGEINGQRTK